MCVRSFLTAEPKEKYFKNPRPQILQFYMAIKGDIFLIPHNL